MEIAGKALVRSIKERCRACYTCVRECPVKAIRIDHGQAQVIPDRCIGCGNCFRVCSRNAKEVLSSIVEVRSLLASGKHTAAIIAPSFPVEFTDMSVGELIARLRVLGFRSVHETAFGADLVSMEYRRLLDANPDKRYIATTCPAIVAFVEKFHPALVDYLAPIISPMTAMARAVRQMYDNRCNVVFIGPCIAKKAEADDEEKSSVDAVLTFTELRTMFGSSGIDEVHGCTNTAFDPPYAGRGRLFPVAKGLLATAQITEDLIAGDVVSTDGRENFPDAISEFGKNDAPVRLLEALSCRGCIMGAGITNRRMSLFERRAAIGRYTRLMLSEAPAPTPLDQYVDLGLSRSFVVRDQRFSEPSEERIWEVLTRMGKQNQDDELNCGACGYETCRKHAIAIIEGIAESEMCLPHLIEQLRSTVAELGRKNDEIEAARSALVHSEKLASMGQLAAGVAHEVNNPLGVVVMYAHLLLEEHGADPRLREDLETIAEQADRCKRIVSGLLNFARQNKTVCSRTDIAELVAETVRTVCLPESIMLKTETRIENCLADVDREQIAQVLVNLFTNAQAAMPAGGELSIIVDGDEDNISLVVADTGIGIPPENISRVFDPFFTTKQIGRGTGLGLAVVYGIVKMHRGSITVKSTTESAEGPAGTVFTVTLPRREMKTVQ